MGIPADLRFAGLVCWLLGTLAISILTYHGRPVGFLCLDRCWHDVLGKQVFSGSFYRALGEFSDRGWLAFGWILIGRRGRCWSNLQHFRGAVVCRVCWFVWGHEQVASGAA